MFCCVAKLTMVWNPLAAAESVVVITDTVFTFSAHLLPLHN